MRPAFLKNRREIEGPAASLTSYPQAERDEDEFVYVASGSDIIQVVLSESDADAVLLIGGEASRMRNQYRYPFHPERNQAAGESYWADHPAPKLGPHDGLTDAPRPGRR